jgi:exosortase
MGLVYLNTILWLIGSWVYNSYYSHGFIVLAVSSYFAYKIQRREIDVEMNSAGLYIISLSLLVHVIASLWNLEYISALSLLTAIYGVIIAFYGSDAAKQLSFPIFFMVFAIPFPLYNLTNQLEVLSAQASVNFVRLFGIEASNIGAEIHLRTASFVVGAPCSGIRSIISLLTLAALYTYLINDRMWVKGILIALAPLLAFLANVTRISLILTIAELYGRDAALGFFHYASDLFLFISALIMLILFRRLMKCMTSNQLS